MVSEHLINGLPKYVWAVGQDGEAYESMLSKGTAEYHGYRLEQDDSMRRGHRRVEFEKRVMTTKLNISLTPMVLEVGSDEEKLAFGQLQITALGRLLTEGYDLGGKEIEYRPGPYVSTYHLAEWLVWNWWRLRWEPRSANQASGRVIGISLIVWRRSAKDTLGPTSRYLLMATDNHCIQPLIRKRRIAFPLLWSGIYRCAGNGTGSCR